MFLKFYTLLDLIALINAQLTAKRVVNGEPGEITDFPYLVHVGNSMLTCSGAIVSRTQVLIAAHCLQNVDTSIIFVRAGSNYRDEGGSIHRIKNVTINEWYYETRKGLLVDDIAIIEVEEPFVYDKTTQKIELNRDRKIQAGEKAVAVGFGLDESGDLSDQFKKLEIIISDTDECNKTYSSYRFIPEGQFCGLSSDKESYSCFGSAGSYVVIGNKLVGIQTYGGPCEIDGTHELYTDVAYQRLWLDDYLVHDEPEDSSVTVPVEVPLPEAPRIVKSPTDFE